MPNPENILKYSYKKGQSGNLKGRPPKLLSLILQELKDEGYDRVTNRDIMEAYEILLGLPREKLTAIGNDESKPMVLRIVSRAMLTKRGYEVLEKMLDRAQGRPKQSIKAEVTNTLNVALVEFLDNGDNPYQSTDTK